MTDATDEQKVKIKFIWDAYDKAIKKLLKEAPDLVAYPNEPVGLETTKYPGGE